MCDNVFNGFPYFGTEAWFGTAPCPPEYVRGPVQAGPREEKNKSFERDQNVNTIQRKKSPGFKVILSMRKNKKSGLKKISQHADFSVCFLKLVENDKGGDTVLS